MVGHALRAPSAASDTSCPSSSDSDGSPRAACRSCRPRGQGRCSGGGQAHALPAQTAKSPGSFECPRASRPRRRPATPARPRRHPANVWFGSVVPSEITPSKRPSWSIGAARAACAPYRPPGETRPYSFLVRIRDRRPGSMAARPLRLSSRLTARPFERPVLLCTWVSMPFGASQSAMPPRSPRASSAPRRAELPSPGRRPGHPQQRRGRPEERGAPAQLSLGRAPDEGAVERECNTPGQLACYQPSIRGPDAAGLRYRLSSPTV